LLPRLLQVHLHALQPQQELEKRIVPGSSSTSSISMG
jgi:hypothetical protein